MHNLINLFEPTSIAIVGASDRPHAVGTKVFKNLLNPRFHGALYAVNPKHKQVQGEPCYSSIHAISEPIDLVVIATPASAVLQILLDCGKKNIRAAIILSAGFSEIGSVGKNLEQSIIEIANAYHIRIIGPNCLGVIRPDIHMNASFDNNIALAGDIALVSQSGAICAAILDWAINKQIGFSSLISLGNCADVDFGDALDYLAKDEKTKSILLYIEGIKSSQKFMRGLQNAARQKPVIAIKGGRNQQGSRAALSHTGAIMGDDAVFDAALKRAGVVRVMTIEALFDAAKILAGRHTPIMNNQMLIITNGGGAGVMAADQAAEKGVPLTPLADDVLSALNDVLPTQWSHQNPIDIIGDATPERYHAVLEICAKIKAGGILVILVPVSMASPLQVAKQIIQDQQQAGLLMTCWMGERQVHSSWELFEKHQIPCFDTPEKAVSAFSYLARHAENQALLSQETFSVTLQPPTDIQEAQQIIVKAQREQRTILTTVESKAILSCFGIPVSLPQLAHSTTEAIMLAKTIGFPVAMKISSPQITHKQDARGVILNITNDSMLATAFDQIVANAKRYDPSAEILGVTLEPMLSNPFNREVMIGVMTDRVFGPVISFGAGGTLVEIMHDCAFELPPLNHFLAKRLIQQTRIAKALANFRHMPPVNQDCLVDILLRVSNMIAALPLIQEMDINPVMINDQNAIAADARIIISLGH